MREKLLVGALISLFGCFVEIEPFDPVDACRSCAPNECAKYYDPCIKDPTCARCFERPRDLLCLMNPMFQALAHCSCDECYGDCSYMCPGGDDLCDACANPPCMTESKACLSDMSCGPCLGDPFLEECKTNSAAIDLNTCRCGACPQECIWECPGEGAAMMCAECMTAMCGEEFGSCMGDESCSDCFQNSALPGCDEHPRYTALLACVCPETACAELCDSLFCTPP